MLALQVWPARLHKRLGAMAAYQSSAARAHACCRLLRDAQEQLQPFSGPISGLMKTWQNVHIAALTGAFWRHDACTIDAARIGKVLHFAKPTSSSIRERPSTLSLAGLKLRSQARCAPLRSFFVRAGCVALDAQLPQDADVRSGLPTALQAGPHDVVVHGARPAMRLRVPPADQQHRPCTHVQCSPEWRA
jgi:hypothetical protein